MMFNSNLTAEDKSMLNIFYQNGMQNTVKSSNSIGDLIKQKTGKSVGLIINSTNPTLGTVGDIVEYLPHKLYLKDVLNGEVLQQIGNNGNAKNLVIVHSAGNEDIIKAAQVLKSLKISEKSSCDEFEDRL